MYLVVHIEFFTEIIELIMFFYGLGFFILGLAVLLKMRPSRLAISASLPWLAAFGIIHGLHEWSEMFGQIYPDLAHLNTYLTLNFLLLLISTLMLIFFGTSLLWRLSGNKKFLWLPVIFISIWLVIVISFAFTHSYSQWIQHSGNIARYLFYFTGSLISGIALTYQYKTCTRLNIARNFLFAAIALFLNALFAGLIATETPFFPASIINTRTFLEFVGFPVQFFRGLLAITIAFFIIRGLNIFSLEEEQQLQKARDRERAALDETERLAKQYSLLYQQQKNIASVLQRSLLPIRTPRLKSYNLGIHYRSATQEAAIGGDFYDFISVNGIQNIIIGDVSGKGVKAASETANIKSLLQYFLRNGAAAKQAVADLNRALYKQYRASKFFTMLIMSYDQANESLAVVNAGHPSPLVYSIKSDSYVFLTESGIALAVVDKEDYPVTHLSTRDVDLFVAYTDGLLEARYDSKMYGEDRIKQSLTELKNQSAQEIADNIARRAVSFSGNILFDDLLVLVMKKI